MAEHRRNNPNRLRRHRPTAAALTLATILTAAVVIRERSNDGETVYRENKALANPWVKLDVIASAIDDDDFWISYGGEYSLPKADEPMYTETVAADGSRTGTVLVDEALLFFGACNTKKPEIVAIHYSGRFPPAGEFKAEDVNLSFLLPKDWSQAGNAKATQIYQSSEQLRENASYAKCFEKSWREKIPQLPHFTIPNPFDNEH